MEPTLWHHYQTEAAQALISLGYAVEVDAVVRGVRATHKADVAVRLETEGIQQTWLVECKYQKRKVTKSAVAAFKSIVMDTGAEKGILLCEVGFQPAAIAASCQTNVALTSLTELKVLTAPALRARRLNALEQQALRLVPSLKQFQIEEPYGAHGTMYRGVPGVDFRNVTCARGALDMLCAALQAAKIGKYGHLVSRSFPKEQNSFIRMPDSQSLLEEGERLVAELTSWMRRQEAEPSALLIACNRLVSNSLRRLVLANRAKPLVTNFDNCSPKR